MADEALGRIAIEMDLKDSKFRTNLQGTNKAVRNAMSEMKANMAVVSQAGSKYDILATKQRGLNRVIEAQKNQLQALKNQYEGSITKSGEWTNATANYAKKYNDASAKVAQLNKQLVANAQQMEIVRTKTMGITGKLNSFGEGAVKAGERLTGIGRTMTGRVTTPIVAGFTYAAKSAVDFNSQIQAMGPLLTNGGTVTAKYKAQLEQLSASSMKWSKQYGVSTTSINEGMSEMIKRGYTAQQTLGAMPSVLNAAKASGDDFNTVMSVSTATLEQFGLKVNSTSGMLKNTQRVTDTLTYVSNATAAGFQDLGEAMTYVGPTAHSANISLEQTAAALGIMSNRGIEGSVAGTALRGALTRLMKPSKQNAAAFKEMGINVGDFKKGTLTLPGIIDKIKKNTAGWTAEQRASAIATAFGTEAQAGMNALIAAGGDELREYTEGAKKASGTTKKIADQLNNTEKAKLERFKQSVHVLAIEIGQKLLPALTPTIEKASDWIDAFSKMDSSTQQMIVKAGLFAAAIGPMSMLLGGILKPLGMLTQGTVKTIGFFRAWKAGASVLQSVSDSTGIATSAFEVGSGAVGRFGAKAAAGKASLALLGESAGSAGMAINLLNPYVLGTVAAVGLGVAAWQLWGKEAYRSADSTNRWGTGVSETADKALSSMKNTTQGINDALNNMSDATKTSTKEMSKAFDDELSAISKTVDTRTKEINDGLKGLDKNVKDAVQKEAKKEKKSLQESLQNAKDHYNQAQTILKNHNGKVSDLSDEERAMLRNNQQAMQEEELKILNITGSKKKTIMAALNNDVTKMTSAQRKNAEAELADYQRKEVAHFTEQKKKLAKAYGENSKEYKAGVKELESSLNESSTKTAAAYIRVAKANGESTETIKQNMLQVGLSYKNGMAELEKQSKKLSKSTGIIVDTTGEMSKKVKNAGDAWNKLVFDPKTGKVKTNAQEEVNKAVGSSKQWNKIKLLLKEGKLSTNAKEMVAKATVENGKWDTLSWKEKYALIKTKGGANLVKLLEKSGRWNDLSIEAKEAIINSKGQDDLVKSLQQAGVWNQLDLKELKAIFGTKGQDKINEALLQGGQWNNLSLDEKIAQVSSKGGKDLAKMLDDSGQWNRLSIETKEAIVNAKGQNELDQVTSKYKVWQGLPVSDLKTVIAQDLASGKIDQARSTLEAWKRDNPGEAKTTEARDLASQVLNYSKKSVDDYRNSHTGPTKVARGQDSASGSMNNAKNSVDNYKRSSTGGTKVAKAVDHASGPAKSAYDAVSAFSRLKDHTVNMITNFISKHVKGNAKGTNYHSGGLMMVNDQPGPVFREMVQFPSGETFIPQGRNVMFDAPRGSKVLTASKTARRFPGLKQYAKGTELEPKLMSNMRYLNARDLVVGSSSSGVVVNNNQADISKLEAKFDTMIELMQALLQKPSDVLMNGQKVGELVAPEVANQQLTGINLESRGVYSGR